jgi:hypothetical protein
MFSVETCKTVMFFPNVDGTFGACRYVLTRERDGVQIMIIEQKDPENENGLLLSFVVDDNKEVSYPIDSDEEINEIMDFIELEFGDDGIS